MNPHLYCVYLTTYSGNKLPPFYIGHTLIKNINNGYRGSVVSNAYVSIWKSEIKTAPQKFKTRIIKTFETKAEAEYWEGKIQRQLKVVKSPLYVNLHDGLTATWISKNLGQPHYLVGTNRYLDERTGKDVFLKESEVKSHHSLNHSLHGKVSARDKNSTEFHRITSEEFATGNYVGPNLGKLNCLDIKTNKCIQINVCEFDRKIHRQINENMVGVKDLNGNPLQVTKEEYHKNSEIYIHNSTGNVVVFDINADKLIKISTDEYNASSDNYVTTSNMYVKIKNKETGDILRIKINEYADEYKTDLFEVIKKITMNGKNHSDETKEKMSKSHEDLRWFHSPDLLIEKMYHTNQQPIDWIAGRKPRNKPNKKRESGKSKWIHCGDLRKQIPISENIPEGWIAGSGIVSSKEANASRSAKGKERRWIYNPTTNQEMMILKTDTLPEGWAYGSQKIRNRKDPATGKFKSDIS